MASQRLAIQPGLSVNRVTLPWGEFTATLASARTTYTVTPQMFVSGLIQYNSSGSSLGSNIRLRWEYQPGSTLFVVWSQGRDTEHEQGDFALRRDGRRLLDAAGTNVLLVKLSYWLNP
jgi:hypothetical protein